MLPRYLFALALSTAIIIGTDDVRADDDCEDIGKLGVMFGQIDQQCSKYELTAAGKKTMLGLAARATVLGGEECARRGKIAMLRQLSVLFPQLDQAATSGNQTKFNAALCDAIAKYLEMSAPEGVKAVRARGR